MAICLVFNLAQIIDNIMATFKSRLRHVLTPRQLHRAKFSVGLAVALLAMNVLATTYTW